MDSGGRKKSDYILPIIREPESHPDFHRVPPAIRRPDPRHHPAIRGVGRNVPGTRMDRHRGLRVHGPAHAPMVRQAVGQADIQPLLRGVVISSGLRTADGSQDLNFLSIFRWRPAMTRSMLRP